MFRKCTDQVLQMLCNLLLTSVMLVHVSVPVCQTARFAPFPTTYTLPDSRPASYTAIGGGQWLRRLQRLRQLQEHADVSYSAYSNARTIKPASSGILSRSATTPRDAESTANAAHTGIKKLTAPSNRRSYATVQAYHDLNPFGKEVAILPRTKASIDRPGGPQATAGTNSAGILAMGGAAVAQTYEGANAVSTTDSVDMDQGDGITTLATNLVTTTAGRVIRASKTGSYGATSQPVGSLALSGSANGNLFLAQADSAVALVQVEKSSDEHDKRFERDRFRLLSP